MTAGYASALMLAATPATTRTALNATDNNLFMTAILILTNLHYIQRDAASRVDSPWQRYRLLICWNPLSANTDTPTTIIYPPPSLA
jgi:hypothetical protein